MSLSWLCAFETLSEAETTKNGVKLPAHVTVYMVLQIISLPFNNVELIIQIIS